MSAAATPSAIGSGRVVLVGAGPGAPDLLTLRAVNAIAEADVVLHDRLVPEAIIALAPSTALVIDVGKRPGGFDTQGWIHQLLVEHAVAGRIVVRLKGGDPMVFGRGGEEYQLAVEAGIPVEVVPGVTSAVGVATSVGLPVTHRGVSSGFAVVAGHTIDAQEWWRYAGVDTLVVLMGVGRRRLVAASLIEAGRRPDEPVAFIESGSTPEQRCVTATLDHVAAGHVEVASPAVWVIGDVVTAISWLQTAAMGVAGEWSATQDGAVGQDKVRNQGDGDLILTAGTGGRRRR